MTAPPARRRSWSWPAAGGIGGGSSATSERLTIPASFFATATYSRGDGAIIVKVVNARESPVDMLVNLRGVTHVESNGTAIVLAGEPSWTNSIDEPRKVAPRQETVANAAPSFHRTFPPHSLTILRLKTTAPRWHRA